MTAPAATPARHTKPAPADLRKFEVAGPGVVTTIGFLRGVLDHRILREGHHTAGFVDDLLAPGPRRRGGRRASVVRVVGRPHIVGRSHRL
jgi:pyruvate carboxylase